MCILSNKGSSTFDNAQSFQEKSFSKDVEIFDCTKAPLLNLRTIWKYVTVC